MNEVLEVQLLAGILGCVVGSLPTSYIGMPLGAKNKILDIWNGVVRKFEKRLAVLSTYL